MDYICGSDHNQLQFFALEEMVAADSCARVIDLFVDVLTLQDLGFKHASLQKEGLPPYYPSLLLRFCHSPPGFTTNRRRDYRDRPF